MEFVKRRVCLNDEDLYNLDRQLTIEMSKLTPGEYRTLFRPEEQIQLQVPERKELEDAKSEILREYRTGVEIASQAESRPLISLFEKADVEVPPELKVDHEQMRYNFYMVEVTFSSSLPSDQFLLSAELELTLTDDVDDPARRTRPIRFFPGRKDIQLFNIDLEGAIGIDAGMNFLIPMAGSELLPFSKVEMDGEIKARFAAGPFHFHFRKAAIEVKGKSSQNIFWRYHFQSEHFGANDFKSVLVLKIAEEASSVQMLVSLGAVPCKRRWIFFKDSLPQIPDSRILSVELKQKKE